MKNIAVIGAGGIGSYFLRFMHRAEACRQLTPSLSEWHVYDDDTVEPKNLRHQDYETEHVSMHKVVVAAALFGICPKPYKFVQGNLNQYDFFVIAADNPAVRTLVYTECLKSTKKGFLDMRTEGTRFALFTSYESPVRLMRSLGTEKTRTSEVGRSCQLAEDVKVNKTQFGNIVVSSLGAQVMLDLQRDDCEIASILGDASGKMHSIRKRKQEDALCL